MARQACKVPPSRRLPAGAQVHHPRLIDHFRAPRHAGELAEPDAVVEVSNPVCGDILKLWVKAEAGRVAAVRFKCRGCVAAMACGSALTELVSGRELTETASLTTVAVEEAVGELEAASKHAAVLAVDAWRAALQKLGA